VDCYLVKPVSQSDLLDAILEALHPATRAERSGSRRAAVSPQAPAVRPLRVLLAEDNAVNQKLAVHLLEKQGHQVTVAGSGRGALAAGGVADWGGPPPPEGGSRDRFDLVLMDVQMPELGGFEATAAIRADEKKTGGHIPIIALTAHAMKGDRERCLAAGMDD